MPTLSRSRFSQIAEDLLANPLFASTFASALQKGIETKGALDRNLQTVLGLLNLPSKSDVRKILTKLEVVQASLLDLHEKVDRLVAAERRARRARRTRTEPDAG